MVFSRDNRVSPHVAIFVFSSMSVLVLSISFGQIKTVYGYLSLFAWVGSFIFFGLRGFWNSDKNAFAKIETKKANFIPVVLTCIGIAALLDGVGESGILTLVLACAWTFFSPFWLRVWKEEPIQIFIDILSIFFCIAFFIYLLYLLIN